MQRQAAQQSHLRVGFKPTGITTTHGPYQYEVISLEPGDVPFFVNPELMVDGIKTEKLKDRLGDFQMTLAEVISSFIQN